MSEQTEKQDYEAVYDDYWKSIVENPDGSLNIDQVKRELSDFRNMIQQVPRVYSAVTDGRVSKPNTYAAAVIAEFEDVSNEDIRRYVGEALDEVSAIISRTDHSADEIVGECAALIAQLRS